ncbi:MAG TPA: acyl-CoA thioesterase [Candidatus Competibacteraceae bacterium]|nr:MAG: acyl-CoA thioesterase [Candidatus Competibacteraceae bacterium]HOB62856.1 acyl-CoA thioesterase [Candidatus Competibacteraceae bacterium]HQA27127.1 acyl-CoA thioesterase [Candidatus Competibacteraceae bacterium]HQD57354.1 acyl-CoA thioesterase [Candidatus Competibacteraceae bacterium]
MSANEQEGAEELFPRDRQPTVRILAMPAYANPNGNIFGGWIMAQMDIAGSVVAVEYSGGRVSTVAATSMEFHKPVFVGDLVSCFAQIQKVGSTSITVKVEVFVQRAHDGRLLADKVTEAVIVYVAIGEDGKPSKLPERGPDFGRYW